MRLFALTVLLVGCGGDSDGGTDTLDTDGGTAAGDPCEDVPEFDIDGLSCEQLGTAYESILDASDVCSTAGDCKAVRASCEHWNAVNCWYVANDCADDVLDDFDSASAGCIYGTNQCTCTAAPAVDCISGKCQFVYSY